MSHLVHSAPFYLIQSDFTSSCPILSHSVFISFGLNQSHPILSWLILSHPVFSCLPCLFLYHSISINLTLCLSCLIPSHPVLYYSILSYSVSICLISSHPVSPCSIFPILSHSASLCFILSQSVLYCPFCFNLFHPFSSHPSPFYSFSFSLNLFYSV